MIDFERNYRIRRAISQALQQSQKSECHAAELSAKVAVAGKRDLLLLLSKWLLELNSASVMPGASLAEIQSLTRISLESWLQFQVAAVQNEKDLREAEGKSREAEDAFKKKAPAGWVTKIAADAESKSQIKTLQDSMEAARRHRESLSKAIAVNVKNRQTLAEAFFRDCLKQREKLATTQALGKEAGAILNRMAQETNTLWVEHRKQQAGELDQIAQLLEDLRGSYKATPAPVHPQHKVPSPQEQSDVHLGQGNS